MKTSEFWTAIQKMSSPRSSVKLRRPCQTGRSIAL
jgi:hypothetical protein